MAIIITILILLALWSIGSYLFVRNVEEPQYEVVAKKDGYEIRAYKSYIIAEVEVAGDQDDALRAGFRLIADYIFGNNTVMSKIAMTVPVLDEAQEAPSEKIAMTVPVIDEALSDTIHKISFIMPSQYTLETIPKPNDKRVQLKVVEQKKVAALRFTWYATESRVEKQKARLAKLLQRDGIATIGNVQLAQYNPPLSAPYMRRNEILVEIENEHVK